MKRYIHSASSINIENAAITLDGRDFIEYLNTDVAPQLFEAINERVFDPIAEHWMNNILPTLDQEDEYVERTIHWINDKDYHCYYAPTRTDFACEFWGTGPDDFYLRMGAFGWGMRGGNSGLLFLADIGSGGYSTNSVIYISKMRAKQRREMDRILSEISLVLNDFGLKVIEPIKKDSSGYKFYLSIE